MNKNFWQRLQKVKIKDCLHIFLFLFAIIPAIFYKKNHKHLWLVSECGDEARDNGYWFYKYVREHDTNQEIVYAIKKKSYDYNKVALLGSVVNYGSLKHWILYLACEIRISSQKAGSPNNALCYLLENCGIVKKKMVFLQHGIIKDDLPYVHSDKAKISLFATTTKREYEYVKKNFGFDDSVVQQIGMCRFDNYENYYKQNYDNNLILIMPTWRQWIANRDYKTKNVEYFRSFKDTEYFKTWNGLINSEKFLQFLEFNHKHAIFYLHRNMQKYTKYFKSNNLVEVAYFPDYDVHELLKQASILITDYSSVAMDFAYMGKKVLYYQFDYGKFREFHLEKSYFSYENDGFGGVAYHQEGVMEWLWYYTHNYNDRFYEQRINDFFDLRDNQHCERTYKAVKELANNG